MVDTRAYFTAATATVPFFATNFDNIKLTRNSRKLLSEKYPHSNCTGIVPYGSPYSLGSGVGSGRLTDFIRNITPCHYYHLSVIIGILLTDAWLQLGKANWNARLGLKQGMVNFEYLFAYGYPSTIYLIFCLIIALIFLILLKTC